MRLSSGYFIRAVPWLGAFFLVSFANGLTADDKVKTEVADLRYGVALYHYYQQDYLSALSELMVADTRDGIQGHGDNPELIAGGVSLAFGMQNHAEHVFLNILQDERRPQQVRDAAWFYLGKLHYLRGDLNSAAESFARVSKKFKPALHAQLQSLKINIAIHQMQYGNYSLKQIKRNKLNTWSPYVLYNLGAAHARSGDFEIAQDFFRELTSLNTEGDFKSRREHWALQDKAHNAMGYSYLAQKSYPAAISEFTQVRLNGAFSNQALLGYGWAAVASENYTMALNPWQLLRSRSLIYPAVQESLLALPYAYEKLGAKGEAMSAYQMAEVLLEQEIQLVRDMRATLTEEELLTLVGSEPVSAETLKEWSKQSVADEPGMVAAAVTDDGQNWLKLDQTSIIKTRSAYLSELFAQNQFQTSVLELRDLLRLQKLLQAWEPKLEIYRDLLLEKQASRNRQEQQLAGAKLAEQEQTLMAQRNELARKISAIEASDDYMALADDDSRELYPLVMRSQQTIARMKAAGQDTSEEESRLKMFGGILLWQAAQEYPGRLAALKSQQQQVEKTLADLQATRERIETIMATSIDIQPMLVRLQESGKENQATLARTHELIQAQGAILRQQVDKQLAQHEKRLVNYLAQSHLAVARLYDAELRKQPE
jgi:TolA-binding protein